MPDADATGPAPAPFQRLAKRRRARRLGHTVLWRARVDSTNAWVRRLAEEGAPEGVLALADAQSHGRGRHGRRWESPAGLGLYCSVLLRPLLPAERLGLLTLASGVAAAAAVRRTCGLQARLQWPNDLIVEGQKLGGILVETSLSGARLRSAAVGWGLNLKQRRGDFPPGLRRRATSLRLQGVIVPEPAELAGAFVARLEELLGRLEVGACEPILRSFRRLAPGSRPGARLRVEIEGHPRRAVCRGVEVDGALRVELPEGERLLRGADLLRVLECEPC